MLPIETPHPERHILGNLCKYGHAWQDTGQSLRYKHNGVCVQCKRANHAKQMQDAAKREKYREQNREAQRRQRSTEEGRKKAVSNVVRSNRKRRATDPYFALVDRLRNRVRRAFAYHTQTGKVRTSRQYGIDYSAIIRHIGECPGNRKDYHIDHIIPLSHFNLNDPEHVKQAFAPENHQWLLSAENISKRDRTFLKT